MTPNSYRPGEPSISMPLQAACPPKGGHRFIIAADDARARERDIAPMKLITPVERTAASQWFDDELVSAARERTPSHARTALVERSAPQGAMPPLHRRDEDETYRVLEGEVTFFIDDDVVPARPGDVV